jgi:hypothetical protein
VRPGYPGPIRLLQRGDVHPDVHAVPALTPSARLSAAV